MKWLRLILLVSCLATASARAGDMPTVYQLRVYTAAEGMMPALLERFRDHTCALFQKHGIEMVGAWTPADPAKDGNKLYYVVCFKDANTGKAAWAAFREDPEWIKAKADSEARAGGPLVARVDTTDLAPTDYSPPMPKLEGSHVFELRTYITNPGKLDGLDARFRDHTLKLFGLHGMINLPYWHPVDPEQGAGTTLVYLLAHASREAAAKSWSDFINDPEWKAVRAESEKDGTFLVRGPASVYLVPTDFSPLK
jgi:hypothetical protein